MFKEKILPRLPGIAGTGLMILVTSFWMYWSVAEMYHEGWWGAWYNRVFYLIPGTAFLLLTLICIRWPRAGGWITILLAGAFTIFFMDIGMENGRLTMNRDPVGFLLSGAVVLFAILFLLEARYRRRHPDRPVDSRWWRRNLAYLLALAPQAIIFVTASAVMLPFVLTRSDDGDYGTRLIAGNEQTLIWAPEGPGWNFKQDYGGYPSWQMVALYGVEPVGMGEKPDYGSQINSYADAADLAATNICRYLAADGLTLQDTPQDIWRMPTVDEMARAMTRHGENAGCAWHGEYMETVPCDVRPDKETPLWNPNLAPIYYWAAEEYNEREAYFIAYNGFVNSARKTGGNPRHSYRCVRNP